MNLDRLDKWLSLTTNIGVLVGIALLVFELNQNTELTRAEIHAIRAVAKTDRQMFLANSGEIARIAQTSFAAGFPGDPDALSVLTPEERFRYGIFLQGLKEAISNWHYQCEQGLLDDELCRTGYESEVRSALPLWNAMRIGLENTQRTFIIDVRRIGRDANMAVPNEDGSW